VFTHLSHEIDVWRQTDAQTLPVGVEFGSDGLVIEA
jgi:hypothetical protein